MATKTRKRGSYAVGRERRERILEVAAQSFADAGYSNTSLAGIAREVGITTPGLTHHFPTKQHLLLAIVEQRFDVTAEAAAAAEGEIDGTRTLRLLQSLTELFASRPELMGMFVMVSAEAADPASPAHSLFRERYERTINEITGFFSAEAEAGFLRDDVDYREVARECVAVSDGLQLQHVVSGGRIDLVALSRAHLERLAPSILTSGERIRL